MKWLIVAAILLIGYVGGFYRLYVEYQPLPRQIKNVERNIEKRREDLLSAQILDQKLNKVADLLKKNVALSTQDSLAKQGSVPFIDEMTDEVNRMGLSLLSIEPKPQRKIGNFVRTPYDIKIEGTYEQITNLLEKMEKSPRLIYVNSFEIKNELRRYLSMEREEDLGKYIADFSINTLTLVKG